MCTYQTPPAVPGESLGSVTLLLGSSVQRPTPSVRTVLSGLLLSTYRSRRPHHCRTPPGPPPLDLPGMSYVLSRSIPQTVQISVCCTSRRTGGETIDTPESVHRIGKTRDYYCTPAERTPTPLVGSLCTHNLRETFGPTPQVSEQRGRCESVRVSALLPPSSPPPPSMPLFLLVSFPVSVSFSVFPTPGLPVPRLQGSPSSPSPDLNPRISHPRTSVNSNLGTEGENTVLYSCFLWSKHVCLLRKHPSGPILTGTFPEYSRPERLRRGDLVLVVCRSLQGCGGGTKDTVPPPRVSVSPSTHD